MIVRGSPLVDFSSVEPMIVRGTPRRHLGPAGSGWVESEVFVIKLTRRCCLEECEGQCVEETLVGAMVDDRTQLLVESLLDETMESLPEQTVKSLRVTGSSWWRRVCWKKLERICRKKLWFSCPLRPPWFAEVSPLDAGGMDPAGGE